MTEGKAKLDYYKERCTEAYEQLQRAKRVYEAHKREWGYWRDKFEALDHSLALEDGRLHICPCGKKAKEPVKPAELTKDQLLAIAEKLGIEIKEPDKEIDDEEE